MSEIQFFKSGIVICSLLEKEFLVYSRLPSKEIGRTMALYISNQYSDRPNYINLLIETKEVLNITKKDFRLNTDYFKTSKAKSVISEFIINIQDWLS
jgi:hypothetical protein